MNSNDTSTKVAVWLNFLRSELLNDIKSISFVEGDVMRTDDPHDHHQVMDIAEDGNIDLVSRWMNLAISDCVEALHAFTRQDITTQDQEIDILDTPEKYSIRMLVPEQFSKTTLSRLNKLIHEFVVARVLAEWFTIAYPPKAEIWRLKANTLKESIDKTKLKRSGRTRRTQTPF